MRYAISKIIQTCSFISAQAVLIGCLSFSVAADPADVRVLVDVSGSMKQADPKSVRGPATALLAALLPDNSLGGIWLFGSDVRELVPHGAVDARWSALGQPIEASIGSTDRFTHIESALRTGVDIEGASAAACHVILITDGIVDVQGGPEASRASRDRILKSVVPSAVDRNCRIHTIALSDQADLPLLRQLALQTEGLFTLIEKAGDLIPVMLDALELALRSQQLPVVDNRIQVDPSISQLRLIRLGDNPTIALQGPDGLIERSRATNRQAWYRGQGYETLLWRQPAPGVYTFTDTLGPNDRILIDSDIQLRLEESAPTIASDQTLGVAGTIIGPDGIMAATDREYRVAFGAQMDPFRVTGSELQTQLDSPAPGRAILTVQSFDSNVQRQVQRAFEVLLATPEMDITNNTAQGVGSVGSPITSPDNASTSDTDSTGEVGTQSIEARVEAALPEELKQWPLWQIVAALLAAIAAVALVVGLVLRPRDASHRES